MITLIPVGGLCNRMRAISAAISLADLFEKEQLRIIWFRDWGLNCCFHDLFHSISLPNVQVKEATWKDILLYDRPRKKNLYLPKIVQCLLFDACLYEKTTWNPEYDYVKWKGEHNNCYLASYGQFYPANRPLGDIFIPLTEITHRIESNTKAFTQHTIGVHIRRSDHQLAKIKSPLSAFIQRMDKAIEADKNTTFYLASDSAEDKRILKEQYGDRIITSANKVRRDSLEGMRDAIVDLYTLANTKKILGSYASSFSEIAAQLKGISLIIPTL